MPSKAGLQNMVLSLPSRLDYSKERNFLGGTVGRIVGRIHGHTWNLGNKKVVLAMNEEKIIFMVVLMGLTSKFIISNSRSLLKK